MTGKSSPNQSRSEALETGEKRKPYRRPEMVEYGTIRELTEGAGFGGFDGTGSKIPEMFLEDGSPG